MAVDFRQEYLSRGQVAERLNLSVERIQQLARAGELPHVRTPLGRLFAAEDVEKFRRVREAEARGK